MNRTRVVSTALLISLALASCGGGELSIRSPLDANNLQSADAKQCDAGDGAACYRAGQSTDYNGQREPDAPPKTSNDAPSAARMYRKGCALDHARSCHAYAGLAFGFEEGVFDNSERDRMKAAYAHYYKACMLGYAEACTDAAYMVRKDEFDPPANPDLEFELEAKACTLGDKGSCSGALSMIEKGKVSAAPEVAADLARRHQELQATEAPAADAPPAGP